MPVHDGRISGIVQIGRYYKHYYRNFIHQKANNFIGNKIGDERYLVSKVYITAKPVKWLVMQAISIKQRCVWRGDILTDTAYF